MNPCDVKILYVRGLPLYMESNV